MAIIVKEKDSIQTLIDCALAFSRSPSITYIYSSLVGFKREKRLGSGRLYKEEITVIAIILLCSAFQDPDGQSRILATLFNHEAFGELALMKESTEERSVGCLAPLST